MIKRNNNIAYLVLILVSIGGFATPTQAVEELNITAHELFQSDVMGSLELFRIAAVGNSDEALDAFRMVGQIEFKLGNSEASINAYRDGLTTLTSRQDDSYLLLWMRIEFFGKLSQGLTWHADQLRHDIRGLDASESSMRVPIEAQILELKEEAIYLRNQLLDTKDLHTLIPSKSIEIYMLKQGHELLAVGRHDEGIAVLEQFLVKFPDWGWDNGRIIQLRFDIVRAKNLDEAQYILSLEAIWYDPKLQGFDLLSMIGNNIVVKYLSNDNYNDVRKMNKELLEYINEYPNSAFSVGLNVHEQQLLIKGLLLESEGDFGGAKKVYLKLTKLFPTSQKGKVALKKLIEMDIM